MRRTILARMAGAAAGFGALLAAGGALAHPHVWVTMKSEIVYAPDGRVSAIRHAWSFDEMYSAFLSQGLDKDKDGKLSREELQELAKVNVESLSDQKYYTVAKANGKPVAVAEPVDYWLEGDAKQLTLNFTLPLAQAPAPKTFGLEVYDPSFFVAFAMAEGDAALTVTGAPKGCAKTLTRAKSPDAAGSGATSSLSESFFQSLGAASNVGGQFANRALVACP